MKLWQKRITSLSLLPLGSKSMPPLPPPMGSVVSEFLKTCSKARNFRMPRLTDGMEAQSALVGADGAVHLDAESAIDLDVALVVEPRNAEHDDALGLDNAFEQTRATDTRDALRAPTGETRTLPATAWWNSGSAGFFAFTLIITDSM